MRTLVKMTWVELKLFLREPLTTLFALVLPLIVLVILGNVFGAEPEEDVFRGVGPITYYTPAYVGLVVASIGLISIPTYIAGNRERGVLRRFQASSVPAWTVVASEVLVACVISVVSAVVLVVASNLMFEVEAPVQVMPVVLAFVISALAFAALGVLLGVFMPTARSAQALGVLLWFVMLFLAGAGPPPEVLGEGLRLVGDLTPLRYAVLLLQDPWLGFGWDFAAMAVLLALGAASTIVAIRWFRWE